MSVDESHELGDELPTPAGSLAAQFVELADVLLTAPTVNEVLTKVMYAARAVVADAGEVSVTVRAPDGRFHTPVATALFAERLDVLQYDLDEGPCVEATRTPGLGLTASADLRHSVEFPRWGPVAAELGVRSVLAVGLFPGGEPPRMGALNFYSPVPNGLDGADRDIALILAAHASTALATTTAFTASELESAQLRTALDSRDVIGQAKGILMERRGISADEAFEVLRAASQNLNIKLTDVARTLAANRAQI
ncbi:ANTAR domain-containing protein [Pseudonocardia sp. TRM90224]|uniref:ANTAR domain-containing protein n=1 Tax=Pseudonocardia sp. TRM90224 TaxID=2812678 RepID=UPI001E598AA7|nr:ANTAR domain-containing protein [Pseudonocardia sp. TRM90224]